MTPQRSSHDDDRDVDRLRGLAAADALSVGLVSAFSGDRPLTEAEEVLLAELREDSGERFHSDLLYAITHQYFPPAAAEKLWHEILQHKCEMSRVLCRNVQITVATLDYLANLRGSILLPTLVNEAQIAEIVGHSIRDGLTGLFNHTSFFEILELELRKCIRYGTAMSLIIADIDDFKKVNDRHGHQEGDRILAELAAILVKETRDADICCRYGGEEFATILPFTAAEEATRIAERIRLGAMRIQCSGLELAVSLGVASYGPDTPTAFALVEKTDQALYQAKRDGKNRVVTAASV
jgi:two-component system cell cycle response regulator